MGIQWGNPSSSHQEHNIASSIESSASHEQSKKNTPTKLTSLHDVTNRSTIYKRNEARRARTEQLRDDPRPPLLRVMSLMPGFSMIVPPYKPEENKQSQKNARVELAHQVGQDNYVLSTMSSHFPKEKKFVDYAALQTSTSSLFLPPESAKADQYSTSSKNKSEFDVKYSDSNFAVQSGIQSFFVAAMAGSLAEYAFGVNSAVAPAPNMRRILGTPLATSTSPFEVAATHQGESSLALHLLGKRSPIDQSPRRLPTTPANSAVFSAGISSAILFGVKTYLEDSPADQRTVYSSLSNSAFAGALVGLFRVCGAPLIGNSPISVSPHVGQHPVSKAIPSAFTEIPKSIQLGQHVLATVLYFGTYEYLCSLLKKDDKMSNDDRDRRILHVALAGGVSGIVQTAVLNGPTWLVNGGGGGVVVAMRSFAPLFARAAPSHALLFYAYETMRYRKEHCPDATMSNTTM